MRARFAVLLVLAACGSKPPTTSTLVSNTAGDPHAVVGPAGKPGHPVDPYKTNRWLAELGDPRQAERAITSLEQLGDPSAIPALGDAWASQGKPTRILQVIIGLARPLTPEQAKTALLTDYETSGRVASWDKALPFLDRALTELDEAVPRSVDSAIVAAEAIGEWRLTAGLDALIDLARKPITKKLISAQVAAIRALGKFTEPSDKAAAALIAIIGREAPPHPMTATDKSRTRALEETYSLYLGGSGAAINALGELHVSSAAKPLVLALYRTPALVTQIRRALVASGSSAKKELVRVLRGESAEVNQLFKSKRLDTYCGDRGDAPAGRCLPVSARDFYAAIVLGDFYDPATVPDLLAALQRPATPSYYMDDQPSSTTQYSAVFDALRKIGAAEAAAPVRAMWSASGKKPDLATQILAVSAYPFVARDTAGTAELGKIASDNTADDSLRQEAATALARLSREPKDIEVLQRLAQKYLEASTAKAKEAAGKQKAAEAADGAFAAEKAALDKSKSDLLALTQDSSRTAQEIRIATNATKKVEADFLVAKREHKERVAPFKQLDSAAKAYKAYARMFQTHIARIEIAIRCKTELPCYAASLGLKPDEAAVANASYIHDINSWTDDEKRELVAATVDRAMLEIGKQGLKASQLTDSLLDAAGSDVRLIRQSILLALPKIAAAPCASCVTKLDAAIRAGEGKTSLGDLNLETTILRNYFASAADATTDKPEKK